MILANNNYKQSVRRPGRLKVYWKKTEYQIFDCNNTKINSQFRCLTIFDQKTNQTKNFERKSARQKV